MKIFPSHGGASFSERSKKVIRLILKGCVNRPFFHISVQERSKETWDPVIEQIGSYDSLPNNCNEKLVAINFQRLEYWLKEGAVPTESVKKLLGLCGYFPVHPKSFREAYLNRKCIADVLEELKIEASKICPDEVNLVEEKDEKLSKTMSQINTTSEKESLSSPSVDGTIKGDNSDDRNPTS